VYLYKLTAIYM